MEIEISVSNKILVFKDWECSIDKSLWHRTLKSVDGSSDDDMKASLMDMGIVLIDLARVNDESIVVKFFGSEMSPINKIYNQLYPEPAKYYKMKECKTHIDKFLNQVNQLKVFL
jgi:hypothetical protein